jgi:hypothetical protein
VVNLAATTVTLSSSVNPAEAGQTVVFTAVVGPVSPGEGTATGTVTFMVDGVAQPPVALGSGSRSAGLKLTTLTPGTHTVVAVYSGDTGFQGSTSGSLTETVGQSATTVTLSSSYNPAPANKIPTLTALVQPVSPGEGTVTGNVVFSVNGVPAATVALVSGKAQYAPPVPVDDEFPDGYAYTVVAQYEGSTGYAASQSATLTQVMDPQSATNDVVTAGPEYRAIGGLFRMFTD